jgi:hypothetical protein
MSGQPVVVIGGRGSWPWLYRGMQRWIGQRTGRVVRVVPAGPWDWFRTRREGYLPILDRLLTAVQVARAEARADWVTLVAHGDGGIVARLFLGCDAYRLRVYGGQDMVNTLVTLGTPHQARGHFGADLEREFANRHYPGAFYAHVRYLAVVGRTVVGSRRGSRAERRAYDLYRAADLEGAVLGDGMIPERAAALPGAVLVPVEGAWHHPAQSRDWYGGSPAVIARWWGVVERAES